MLPPERPDHVHVAFDDHRLVANAGLLLPLTLAHHLGLGELVDRHVDLGRAPGQANTGDKMMTLVASALAGSDCIDDADVLRTGGTARTLVLQRRVVVALRKPFVMRGCCYSWREQIYEGNKRALKVAPRMRRCNTRSESEYWLTSLPGQAAIDRRQLFLPVDDAHSGRLCAWDVVPNRCGGHSTRSVSRVAHAHPGASRPKRNSLSRLWPVQIRDHSPLTLSSPRSRNWRKPRPALIWPKTGSTVAMRRA